MRRPRFPLWALMTAVAGAAGLMAAVKYTPELIGAGVFTFVVVLLTIAILRALHLRGRRRSFWQGFAVVGWVHLILSSDRSPFARDDVLFNIKLCNYYFQYVIKSDYLWIFEGS